MDIEAGRVEAVDTSTIEGWLKQWIRHLFHHYDPHTSRVAETMDTEAGRVGAVDISSTTMIPTLLEWLKQWIQKLGGWKL